MDKIELDRKIYAIENSDDSPETKKNRIATLQAAYDKQQQDAADAANAKREAADNDLKARLKTAFMENPAATESDFERLYPQLRDKALQDAALTTEAALQQASFASARARF